MCKEGCVLKHTQTMTEVSNRSLQVGEPLFAPSIVQQVVGPTVLMG